VSPSPPRVLSRRQVVAGASAVTAAVALSACASYTSGGPQAPPAPAAPQNPGGGAAPLAAATDVPVGGGTVFADRRVVVTQPKQGTFAAFDTTCPHQGCAVNEVTGGTINCPCHGSRFRIADGSVETGPATTGLTARQVRVDGGSIVVS
jgi:Rieske Fe-S protein